MKIFNEVVSQRSMLAFVSTDVNVRIGRSETTLPYYLHTLIKLSVILFVFSCDTLVFQFNNCIFPDFITFLRHYMAHIENQLITSNNWVVLGGASEKHVPL